MERVSLLSSRDAPQERIGSTVTRMGAQHALTGGTTISSPAIDPPRRSAERATAPPGDRRVTPPAAAASNGTTSKGTTSKGTAGAAPAPTPTPTSAPTSAPTPTPAPARRVESARRDDDRYEVARLAGHGDLVALRSEWEELFVASRTGNPFSDPGWLTAWARTYVASGDLWVVTVRRDGALVGVLPCHLVKMGLGPLALRSIVPLGCQAGPGLTELPVPLTIRDDARGIVRAAMRFLSRARDANVHWIEMTLGPSVPWLEPQWFPAAGASTRATTIVAKAPRACVRLPLPAAPGGNLALKRNVRESVRRARNRLTKSNRPWTVRPVTDPAEVAQSFDVLSRLHSTRATLPGKMAHHDALAGRTAQFVLAAAVDMAARGRAAIYQLELDGEIIAAQLVLTTPSSAYLSVSGMTEDAWQYSPMALLIHTVAQDTIARGGSDLYLSVGPDEAKLRWSEEIEYYPQFVVVPPTRAARRGFSLYLPASSLARYRRELSLHRRRPNSASGAPSAPPPAALPRAALPAAALPPAPPTPR